MESSVQQNHLPRCKLQVKLARLTPIGQAEQDPNLQSSASPCNVTHLCLTEGGGANGSAGGESKL